MIDEELIFAYIDGELNEADRLRVEQAIAADPDLQAIVAEHRDLGAALDRAFAPILQAPIPPALSASLHAASPVASSGVLSLADERSRRARRPFSQALPHWAALAATLVAGVFGGVMFSGGQAGPVTERNGQLVASGQLKLALNTQLASTQSTHEPVRIGMTFRNQAGVICRSFSAEASDGVACRDGNGWLLRGLLAHDQHDAGAYRMAASPGTTELVDALIVGDALDQAQERAALATNWAAPKGR